MQCKVREEQPHMMAQWSELALTVHGEPLPSIPPPSMPDSTVYEPTPSILNSVPEFVSVSVSLLVLLLVPLLSSVFLGLGGWALRWMPLVKATIKARVRSLLSIVCEVKFKGVLLIDYKFSARPLFI